MSVRASSTTSTSAASTPVEVEMHRDIRSIFDHALQAANPVEMVKRNLHIRVDDTGKRWLHIGQGSGQCVLELSRYKKVVLVGAGKAAVPMAYAVEQSLGCHLTAGRIVTKYHHTDTSLYPLRRTSVTEAGHPVPDENSVAGSQAVLDLMSQHSKDQGVLFLCVISGGGSALLTSPLPGLKLADLQQLNRQLLASGASIEEMNAIRKHLDGVKGGRLAAAARGNDVAALVLSDVIGDPLDVIASGPTVLDPTTLEDCLKLVKKYGLSLPPAVQAALSQQCNETPKDASLFSRVHNVIIGSNLVAMKMAATRAQALGYHPLIVSDRVDGEAREAAKSLLREAMRVQQSDQPVPRPACLIAGGETTVTLNANPGLGGRNQEMAVAAALQLQLDGSRGVVFLAGATDGTDGPTDAAGGIVDGTTAARATAQGVDLHAALVSHSSYDALKALGEKVHLVTGPTGTNVMDIALILVKGGGGEGSKTK